MRKALLTLALVGMMAVPLLAQFRGMFGGGGMDGPGLLANKSVQEELKLTDDQKKDLKAATDARQKAFAKMREDGFDRDTMVKIGEDFNKAAKKVADGLKPAQKKRLLQIEVQLATKNNSVRIFQNSEVQKALKLTEKQQKTIKSTLSDLEKDIKELFQESKGREAFTKVREMNKEAFATVTKSLDADQKKAWETLAGEKFEGKGPPFEFNFKGKGKGKGRKDKKKDDV